MYRIEFKYQEGTQIKGADAEDNSLEKLLIRFGSYFKGEQTDWGIELSASETKYTSLICFKYDGADWQELFAVNY